MNKSQWARLFSAVRLLLFLVGLIVLTVPCVADNSVADNSVSDKLTPDNSLPIPREWLLLRSNDAATLNAALEKPADQWETVVVPEYLPSDNLYFWYRCQISVPKLEESQRAILCFDGVKFSADVWIKPTADKSTAADIAAFTKVFQYVGGSEPFEIDLTPQTKSGGTFDLLVLVRGAEVVSNKPIPRGAENKPGTRPVDNLKDALLWPIGSQGMAKVGIWEPVRLEVRDSVQLDDLFIQTSFRNKTIKIDGTLRNLSDKPITVRLNWTIQDQPIQNESTASASASATPANANANATAIPQLPTQTLEIPGAAATAFSVVQPWPNPQLWSIRDPHLYQLIVNAAIDSTAKTLTFRERFGFREFWLHGDLFYLNGTPMHALGTSKHPGSQIQGDMSKDGALAMFQSVRQANCNFMRLHANLWPKHWVETADEIGMPLIIESGLFCYSRAYALTDPQFWTNYNVHVRALQKKLRNHPAFCCLSLENEILHCGALQVYPDCETKLAEAGQGAKAFDSTRPISFDGDMDPKLVPSDSVGVADVVNPHYPMDFRGIRLGAEDTNWPECAWWIDNGKKMACYPGAFWKWDRKKPLYFGEFLHIQDMQTVNPYSLVLGDDAYNVSHELAMAKAKAETWSMQIPAYRAAGVTGLCPWVITEPGVAPVVNGIENPRYEAAKNAYEPVIAVMEPTNRYFYDQDAKTLVFWLINDTDVERDLNLTVASSAGFTKIDEAAPDKWTTVQTFTAVRLKPAQRKRVELNLDTSKMTRSEADDDFDDIANLFRVRVTLRHKIVDESSADWSKTGRVLPPGTDSYFQREGQSQYVFGLRKGYRTDCGKAAKRFAQTVGTRIAVVGEIGPAVERFVRQITTDAPLQIANQDDLNKNAGKIDFLIIGRNALKSLVPEKSVLAVRSPHLFSERLARFKRVLILEQDEYPIGLFPIRQANLTISAPSSGALTKEYSCKNPFYIPLQGGFECSILYRLGGPQGLVYASTLRCENIVLTQLPIVEEGDVNPRVWDLVEYNILSQNERSNKPFVFDTTGAIQKTLQSVGAEFTDVTNAQPTSAGDGTANADGAAKTDETAKLDVARNGQDRIVLINADSDASYVRQPGERTILCGLSSANLAKWSAPQLPDQPRPLLPPGLALQPFSGEVKTVPWAPSIAPEENDDLKLALYNGPTADLYWYAPRTPGMNGRTRTPRQSAADWAIVPFRPEQNPANALPEIPFGRFTPNHAKTIVQKDCLNANVNVDLTAQLTEKEGDTNCRNYFVEVNARGKELFGENSRLKIYIDGKLQGIIELEDQYSLKRCPVTIEKFPCELKISYFNDLWDPETRIDRNLWFRSARLIHAQTLDGFASTVDPPISAFVSVDSGKFCRANSGVIVDNVKWYKPDFPTDAALRYIISFLRDANDVSFRSPLRELSIPGAQFELKTSLGSLGKYQPGVANIGTNGTLTKTVEFGESGRYKFTLCADGTAVREIYPHLNLRIDGKRVGEFQLVQRERDRLTVEADVEAGSHSVQLQFDNDEYIPSNDPNVPNQDRNVNIESLTIR